MKIKNQWVVHNMRYITPQERIGLLVLLRTAGFRVGEKTTDCFECEYPYLYHIKGFVSECDSMYVREHRFYHASYEELKTALIEYLNTHVVS